MTEKSILDSLENGFEQMAPDIWEELEKKVFFGEAVEKTEIYGQAVEKTEQANWANGAPVYMKMIRTVMPAMAAVILLICMIGWNRTQIIRTITIDVNPSIEIQVNRRGDVKKIIALNNDAKEIISEGMKSRTQDEVLYEVFENISQAGYFSKTENVVLVSIMGEKNKEQVEECINRALLSVGANATVYYQTIQKEDILKWKKTTQTEDSIGKYVIKQKLLQVTSMDAQKVNALQLSELLRILPQEMMDSSFSAIETASKEDISDEDLEAEASVDETPQTENTGNTVGQENGTTDDSAEENNNIDAGQPDGEASTGQENGNNGDNGNHTGQENGNNGNHTGQENGNNADNGNHTGQENGNNGNNGNHTGQENGNNGNHTGQENGNNGNHTGQENGNNGDNGNHTGQENGNNGDNGNHTGQENGNNGNNGNHTGQENGNNADNGNHTGQENGNNADNGNHTGQENGNNGNNGNHTGQENGNNGNNNPEKPEKPTKPEKKIVILRKGF